MTDSHGPTDHESHDPIIDAVRRARHDVAPIAGSTLVDSVQVAKSRRQSKKRRMVGGIAGVAAILIMVTVGIVVSGSSSPDQVATRPAANGTDTGEAGQSSASQAAPGRVTVDPSSGLVDGQTVAVAAHGFDAGTTVTFFECLARKVPRPSSSTSPQASTTLPDGTYAEVPTTSGSTSSDADGSSTSVSGWLCAASVNGAHALVLKIPKEWPSTSVLSEPTVDHTFENEPTIATLNMQVSTTIRDLTGISANGVMSLPPVPDSVTCADQASSPGMNNACTLPTWASLNGQKSYFLIVARGTIDGRVTVRQGPSLIFGPTDSDPPTSQPAAPATTVPVTTLPARSACSSTFPNIDDNTPRGVGPLVAFTPTAATICGYPQNPQSCGKSAGTLLCNPNGVAVTDASILEPFVAELNSLPTVPPGENLHCFLSGGPTVGIVLTAPGHGTNIRVQYFGCGEASNGKSLHVGATSLTLFKSLIGL